MKKEYKAPMINFVKAEVESPMMSHSNFAADSKKNGQGFADDEADIAPAAPKKFWDDEE